MTASTGLAHSHYVNNWTAPPAPLFPPPQMNGAMHHTSDSDLEPALFDFTTIPGSFKLSHHPDTTSTTLPLPLVSDASDTTSLPPDIDYFTLTEVGTTTSWDGVDLAVQVLDNFEKTFGSYEPEYPQ